MSRVVWSAEKGWHDDGEMVDVTLDDKGRLTSTPHEMQPADADKITTREQARDFAIDWQTWQSERSMSWGNAADWGSTFEQLGEKFNLTDEFRENGII